MRRRTWENRDAWGRTSGRRQRREMFFQRSHDKLILINERIRVKIRRIKAHYLWKTRCSGEINVTTSRALGKVTKSYFPDFSDVILNAVKFQLWRTLKPQTRLVLRGNELIKHEKLRRYHFLKLQREALGKVRLKI